MGDDQRIHPASTLREIEDAWGDEEWTVTAHVGSPLHAGEWSIPWNGTPRPSWRTRIRTHARRIRSRIRATYGAFRSPTERRKK